MSHEFFFPCFMNVGVLCLVLVFVMQYEVPFSSFAIILTGKRELVVFFSFVILMACDGDMGWSAVYNCDVN